MQVPKTHKYTQLDSLRGLASLQVMNQHVLLVLPMMFLDIPSLRTSAVPSERALFWSHFSPIHLLYSASEAVLFFFVLSGFVLYSALNKKLTVVSYGQYIIRRFFRLFVPTVAVILLSMLCMTLLYNSAKNANTSWWFVLMWQHPVSFSEFLDLISFRSTQIHNVVTSLWSIEIEIKISILIPLLILIFNLFKKHKVPDVLFSIAIIISSFIIFHHSKDIFFEDMDVLYSYHVLKYSFAFIAGMYTCKFLPLLKKPFEDMGKLPVAILVIIALFYYDIEWNSWIFPPSLNIIAMHGYHTEVVIVTSCLIILLSFNEHVCRILNHKYLVHLGNISFSLYLIHPVILLCTFYSFPANSAIPLIQAITIVASIVAAHFTYTYFEMPVNNLGKKLADAIGPKKRTPEVTK